MILRELESKEVNFRLCVEGMGIGPLSSASEVINGFKF
jgi:hypothetical protein